MKFLVTNCRLASLYRAWAVEINTRQRSYSQELSAGARQSITTCSTMRQSVPKVMERPQLRPISLASDQCQFIVFDLETTGLTPDSDICQIAAMREDPSGQESSWSAYLLPARSINKGAQKTTGLSTEYHNGQKRLCLNGIPVQAQQYEEGILSFYSYLKEQSSLGRHTVLVGYGSDWLDVPVLINNFKRYGISSYDLEAVLAGFSDALCLIRKMRDEGHTSLVKDGLSLVSASLSGVYRHLFNTPLQDAHDATADTKALHRILFKSSLNISPSQLLSHSSSVSSAYEMTQYTRTYLTYLNSMKGKLFNYEDKPKLSISRYIAAKIARSGLSYNDLAKFYKEHGPNGIKVLLSSHCDDSTCRVTNDQKIVEAVIQHFQSLP